MATMVIATKEGLVELTKKANTKELKINLQAAQSFLCNFQARVEQMSINSEQDKSNWNKAFVDFETQIPKELLPEVKEVLRNGLTQIEVLMEPERTWDMLQDIYCRLNCTVKKLEKVYS